jgi:hypothetical protein
MGGLRTFAGMHTHDQGRRGSTRKPPLPHARQIIDCCVLDGCCTDRGRGRVTLFFTGLGNPVGTGLVASRSLSFLQGRPRVVLRAGKFPAAASGRQNVKLTGQWSLRWIK